MVNLAELHARLPFNEHQALLYAERYGIIEYKVKGNRMTYYECFPTEGTYKVVIDLKTLLQHSRTKLKRNRS